MDIFTEVSLITKYYSSTLPKVLQLSMLLCILMLVLVLNSKAFNVGSQLQFFIG